MDTTPCFLHIARALAFTLAVAATAAACGEPPASFCNCTTADGGRTQESRGCTASELDAGCVAHSGLR